MTLTATGFPGSVDSVQIASMARGFGSAWEVGGDADFKVTVTAGDRTVRAAAGVAHAGGVRVLSDAFEPVQLPAVGSGSRWDLVCLRRNWSGAGSVDVTYVLGTPAQGLPAGAKIAPSFLGIEHDQPLALVRVTAGQSAVQEVIDLRAKATKVYRADSLLGLPSLPGAEAVVGGVRHHYGALGGDQPTWQVDPALATPDSHVAGRATEVAAFPITGASGAVSDLTAALPIPVVSYPRRATLRGQVTLTDLSAGAYLDVGFRVRRDDPNSIPSTVYDRLWRSRIVDGNSRYFEDEVTLLPGVAYWVGIVGATGLGATAQVTSDPGLTWLRVSTRGGS